MTTVDQAETAAAVGWRTRLALARSGRARAVAATGGAI